MGESWRLGVPQHAILVGPQSILVMRPSMSAWWDRSTPGDGALTQLGGEQPGGVTEGTGEGFGG